jgi:hypothetical protein
VSEWRRFTRSRSRPPSSQARVGGREWLEWLGPDYDAARCDLAAINKALKKLGK